MNKFADDERTQFLLLMMDADVHQEVQPEELKRKNLFIQNYPQTYAFPQRAPNRHKSGFGNRQLFVPYVQGPVIAGVSSHMCRFW